MLNDSNRLMGDCLTEWGPKFYRQSMVINCPSCGEEVENIQVTDTKDERWAKFRSQHAVDCPIFSLKMQEEKA